MLMAGRRDTLEQIDVARLLIDKHSDVRNTAACDSHEPKS